VKLTAEVIAVADLRERQIKAMFAIYQRYYEPASYRKFKMDFAEKDWVLILRGHDCAIRGFSTMMTWRATADCGEVRFIFSGDTIIEREFWGSQALAFKWIEFAGSIKRSDPSAPLYWLLISKGHRTYRYLAAFARTFYPNYRSETPAHIRGLMNLAARAKFGEAYCERRGIVRHDRDSARLIEDFTGTRKLALNRDAQFFVERNPGHREGDELVCLCELSADNLVPMARRQFLGGQS
jgi:hypothetical protein